MDYVNDPPVLARFGAVHQTMVNELRLYQQYTQAPTNAHLAERWIEYIDDTRIQMGSRARDWGRVVLGDIRGRLRHLNNLPGWPQERINRVIQYWETQIMLWHMPQSPPGA
jgi:hypothetical protein